MKLMISSNGKRPHYIIKVVSKFCAKKHKSVFKCNFQWGLEILLLWHVFPYSLRPISFLIAKASSFGFSFNFPKLA